MRDDCLPKIIICSGGRALLFIMLFLTIPLYGLAKATVLMPMQSQAPPPSSDPETQAYNQWYRAFAARNLEAIIEGGSSFLKAYPDGKFAAFVTGVVDLARKCLSPKQRSDAEVLRSKVKESLEGCSEELRVLLKKILNNEASVNERCRTGATALMYAASIGDRESLVALLRKDANVDLVESTHGWTALSYALWFGNHLIVDDLLQYSPDLRIKDKEGRTALDQAIATANFEILLAIRRRPL